MRVECLSEKPCLKPENKKQCNVITVFASSLMCFRRGKNCKQVGTESLGIY